MLPQLKVFKLVNHKFRRILLGLISCVLCLLLSEPSLKTLGQPATRMPPQSTSSTGRKLSDQRVLVAEVVVQGASGKLQEVVYQTVATKPGQVTTRSQLQKDINAVFKTGWFSNVKAVPEDTSKGVRVTFVVQTNPVLRQVKIAPSETVLPETVVKDSFRSQYDSILNLQTLQTGIRQLNQWYQNNGYALAKVLENPEISKDGTVRLQVAEGMIESVRVQFVNLENKSTDTQGKPIVGKTPIPVILRATELKPGMIFNRSQFDKDLKRVFSLGTLNEVKGELEPSKDPRKFILVLTVQEKSGITEKLVDQAERISRLAVELQQARDRKDPIAEATVLRTLAEVKSDTNLYQSALKLSQRSNDRAGEAEALKGLAYLYNREADLQPDRNENVDGFRQKKKQAISTYQVALKAYQSLNNPTQSAIVLNDIGYLLQEIEDYAAAIVTYRQAAPLFQTLKQPFWEALTLNNLAAAYRGIGEIDQSLISYQQALSLWQFLEAHPNQRQSVSVFADDYQPGDRQGNINLNWMYSPKTGSSGEFKLYVGGNNLPKSNLNDVRFGQAITLLNTSGIYQTVGDYQQALYSFKAAFSVLQLPATMQSLLQASSLRKDSQLMIELMPDLIDAGEFFLLDKLYTDIGWQQQAQHNRDRFLAKGRTLLEKVQKTAKENGQTSGLNMFLPVLSSVFNSLIANADNPLSEAQRSQMTTDWIAQITPIVRQLIDQQSQTNPQWQFVRPWLEVFSNYALGEELSKANKPQQAVNAYRQVLAQWEKLSPRDLQSARVTVSGANGTTTSTIASLGMTLLITELFEQTELIVHAKIYNAMGKQLQAMGKKQEAIEAHQQALQTLQKKRGSEPNPPRTQPNNDLKQVWQVLDSLKSVFQPILAKLPDTETADTLYQLGKAYAANNQTALALESYRRALPLWRNVSKILQEADTHWEIAIVQRQQGNLAQAKTEIETAIARIESRKAQTDYQQQGDKLVPLQNRPYQSYIGLVDYLASKQNYYGFYIDLLMRLHQQSPNFGYEELAFQASERSHARSLGTMLDRSRRPESTRSSNKPRAIQLAQVASSKQLQQQLLDNKTILLEYALGSERSYLWTVTQTGLKTYTLPKRSAIEAVSREFIELLMSPSYRVGSDRGAAQSSTTAVQADAAAQLSQMLLEPVAAQLGNKRLLIVSDGILHYLPFAALPKPGTTGANQIPLLIEHEIVALPSASMQIGIQQRVRTATPSKTLAMLADPIFSRSDQRLRQRTTESEILYPRLPGTRQEANQIVSLVPASKALMKLDAAASRQIATSPELAQYRIIHFASHGTLDSQNPQRSGMVLSIVDDRENLQRSLLSTADAFNLNLSADLVVLSGCTTALGKEMQGEGLIGLTGGLMYAGAKQVVAALWNVDDDSTALLMTKFYQGMLNQGLPPATALRAAQIKLWQSKNWQAPYYWAAFTLQGS